ncbi:unnamed protein product [Prorocentrum cordatum]|uniref:Uncharacterized protein n=1 Tax=Prorocentrum cordatum TaxID=2364126 RepID=A0ABN9XMP0_9DINO|nr:unnamed protein product [Polarella glacialis]
MVSEPVVLPTGSTAEMALAAVAATPAGPGNNDPVYNASLIELVRTTRSQTHSGLSLSSVRTGAPRRRRHDQSRNQLEYGRRSSNTLAKVIGLCACEAPINTSLAEDELAPTERSSIHFWVAIVCRCSGDLSSGSVETQVLANAI